MPYGEYNKSARPVDMNGDNHAELLRLMSKVPSPNTYTKSQSNIRFAKYMLGLVLGAQAILTPASSPLSASHVDAGCEIVVPKHLSNSEDRFTAWGLASEIANTQPDGDPRVVLNDLYNLNSRLYDGVENDLWVGIDVIQIPAADCNIVRAAYPGNIYPAGDTVDRQGIRVWVEPQN
jgi:hypothetical protein